MGGQKSKHVESVRRHHFGQSHHKLAKIALVRYMQEKMWNWIPTRYPYFRSRGASLLLNRTPCTNIDCYKQDQCLYCSNQKFLIRGGHESDSHHLEASGSAPANREMAQSAGAGHRLSYTRYTGCGLRTRHSQCYHLDLFDRSNPAPHGSVCFWSSPFLVFTELFCQLDCLGLNAH